MAVAIWLSCEKARSCGVPTVGQARVFQHLSRTPPSWRSRACIKVPSIWMANFGRVHPNRVVSQAVFQEFAAGHPKSANRPGRAAEACQLVHPKNQGARLMACFNPPITGPGSYYLSLLAEQGVPRIKVPALLLICLCSTVITLHPCDVQGSLVPVFARFRPFSPLPVFVSRSSFVRVTSLKVLFPTWQQAAIPVLCDRGVVGAGRCMSPQRVAAWQHHDVERDYVERRLNLHRRKQPHVTT